MNEIYKKSDIENKSNNPNFVFDLLKRSSEAPVEFNTKVLELIKNDNTKINYVALFSELNSNNDTNTKNLEAIKYVLRISLVQENINSQVDLSMTGLESNHLNSINFIKHINKLKFEKIINNTNIDSLEDLSKWIRATEEKLEDCKKKNLITNEQYDTLQEALTIKNRLSLQKVKDGLVPKNELSEEIKSVMEKLDGCRSMELKDSSNLELITTEELESIKTLFENNPQQEKNILSILNIAFDNERRSIKDLDSGSPGDGHSLHPGEVYIKKLRESKFAVKNTEGLKALTNFIQKFMAQKMKTLLSGEVNVKDFDKGFSFKNLYPEITFKNNLSAWDYNFQSHIHCLHRNRLIDYDTYRLLKAKLESKYKKLLSEWNQEQKKNKNKAYKPIDYEDRAELFDENFEVLMKDLLRLNSRNTDGSALEDSNRLPATDDEDINYLLECFNSTHLRTKLGVKAPDSKNNKSVNQAEKPDYELCDSLSTETRIKLIGVIKKKIENSRAIEKDLEKQIENSDKYTMRIESKIEPYTNFKTDLDKIIPDYSKFARLKQIILNFVKRNFSRKIDWLKDRTEFFLSSNNRAA